MAWGSRGFHNPRQRSRRSRSSFSSSSPWKVGAFPSTTPRHLLFSRFQVHPRDRASFRCVLGGTNSVHVGLLLINPGSRCVSGGDLLVSPLRGEGVDDYPARTARWRRLSRSYNVGVFICIKCSGVHRSLGVHISKVLSIKLDEWTDAQVDSLIDGGGNAAVNMRYEAFLPENIKKPKPDSPIEERSDFIRRKYELRQFLDTNAQIAKSTSTSFSSSGKDDHPNGNPSSLQDKKNYDKQHMRFRQGLGHAFRNSWRKKESEQKAKKNSTRGMVEFVGLIKVNIVKGTNLAIRDVMTSDPYVILSLGHQSMKTRVIKSNLNPIWNESLMLSIPDPIPPLKLQVYDKDTFTADDRMGEAEIDIQPLVSAAKAYENSNVMESMQLGKWLASEDNTLVKDSVISLVEGKVKQEMTLKLQNVERGHLEIELECVPLSH